MWPIPNICREKIAIGSVGDLLVETSSDHLSICACKEEC